MPQQNPSSSQLAAELAALYILAEQQLLAGATGILRRTLPDLTSRQAMVVRLRRLVRAIFDHLNARTDILAVAMVTSAIVEGREDASTAVSKALEHALAGNRGGRGTIPPGTGVALPDDPFDLSMPHGEHAAQAIRDDITSELEDVRFRITRLPDDIYKAIAPHGGIYQVRANDFTPARAQAAAWRVFASQGVTGFTDKSGRDWSLSAYTEMAVRTAAARAYNASHLARMHALGIHYFTVDNTGHPCPLCFPWQGKVLTDGIIAEPEMVVDATIAEATAAGLFHPNCRHTLIPVIPGVTVLPDPQVWTDEQQRLYNLTQTQRRLELTIRKAKRALEYAIDADARRRALADVRDGQAKLREFIRATGFNRQSRREQVDLTDQRIKMPVPIR